MATTKTAKPATPSWLATRWNDLRSATLSGLRQLAGLASGAAQDEVKYYRSDNRFARYLIAGFGWLFLAIGGYFATYHLFFHAQPLSNIVRSVEGVESQEFRYDFVSYFRGWQIEAGGEAELLYGAPRVLGLSRPQLEFFVETSTDRSMADPAHMRTDDAPATVVGTLTLQSVWINEEADPDTSPQFEITDAPLQRHTVDWQALPGGRTHTRLIYQPLDGATDAPASITLAARVTGVNLVPQFVFFLVIGIMFLAASDNVHAIRSRRLSGLRLGYWPIYLLLVLFGYYIHSGAFISNELFPGHSRMASYQSQLQMLIETGHQRIVNYRNLGMLLTPFLTQLVEGAGAGLREFRDYFPTSKYLVFVMFAAAVIGLSSTLKRIVGIAAAIVVATLAFAHIPFIVDLYVPDADAYFIVFFPLILTVAYWLIGERNRVYTALLGLVFLMFLVGITKVTAVFLALSIPAAFFLHRTDWQAPFKSLPTRILPAAALTIALVFSYAVGSRVSDASQHPERHIGVEGEPFQETVIWHMIWAAAGNYDDHNAHWFTKRGALRNERVSDRTGLEPITYLRQSQTALEEVYHPDVIHTLREDPGFFYSTAYLRAYGHGLKLFRYSFGRPGPDWEGWASTRPGSWVEISGERVREGSLEMQAIRRGEAWRFSPVLFLGKLTQADLTFTLDLIFLILAALGMLLVRNTGMQVLMISAVLVQLAFSTLIHGVNRYFMFADFGLLIGLATVLTLFVQSLANARTRPLDTD